jgi:hypothetical protein
MKRGWRILLIVAVSAVVAAVTALVWPGEKEPEFDLNVSGQDIRNVAPFGWHVEGVKATNRLVNLRPEWVGRS